MRVKMMEKRMRKLEFIVKELPDPVLEGPADADITLVGFGSTHAIMTEAREALAREGIKVNVLAPVYLWPFKAEPIKAILSKAKMTLGIEANYTGQFAKLLRMETGISLHHHLRKYDGEPFEPGQVIAHIKQLLAKKPKESTITALVSDEGLPADFSPIAAPGSEAVRVH
jgi:2-oxoglutarate ferredoxin oxidoreductase subunit alpha